MVSTTQVSSLVFDKNCISTLIVHPIQTFRPTIATQDANAIKSHGFTYTFKITKLRYSADAWLAPRPCFPAPRDLLFRSCSMSCDTRAEPESSLELQIPKHLISHLLGSLSVPPHRAKESLFVAHKSNNQKLVRNREPALDLVIFRLMVKPL